MLDEIKGQEKAIKIIKSLIKKNRFPNSLLFYGPKGTGKFLTAKSIVKYFNCLNENPELKGKDNCNNCRRIEEENFPDLFIIRQEKKVIKIEQIRETIKQVNLKSFESKYKFFIIDGADSMNIASENSFLKTLEEPPPENYIILIAHNLNALLDTIISRCIKIQFTPLTPKIISQILIEKKNIDPLLAKKISIISNGSMYKAYELLSENNFEKVFNTFETFISFLREKEINVLEFEKVIEEVSKWDIELIEHILELFLLYFIDLLIVKKYNIRESEIFKNYLNIDVEYIKFNSYNRLLSKIIEARYNLTNTNINTKLLLESLFLTTRNILNESSKYKS